MTTKTIKMILEERIKDSIPINDGLAWGGLLVLYKIPEDQIIEIRSTIKKNIEAFDLNIFKYQNVSQELKDKIRSVYKNSTNENLFSHDIFNDKCIKCGTKIFHYLNCETAVMMKVLM